MNVDEYRQFKQQEQERQQAAAATQAAPPVEQEQTTAAVVESAPAATTIPDTQTTPEHVEIDGQTYTLEELKSGMLRQSDYTRKTQELAREKERLKLAEDYFQAVNSKPEFAKEVADSFGLPYHSPEEQKFADLQQQHQEALLKLEIATLEKKYTDFDADEAVSISLEKGIANLEDAYHLARSTKPAAAAIPDVATLTEQIRQSIMQELQSTVDTSTIISAGGDAASIAHTTPELSPQEQKVAAGLKLTPEEYLAFKNQK